VGHEVHQSAAGWSPVYVEDNLGVMSIGFMLPNSDDAVIWRGPKKNGLIKQFLSDVDWGDLDYLIIDTPPGTSDEHISIVQYLKSCSITGAVVVTTPQEVSMADVRKELNFCKKTGIKVLGIVENMADISISCESIFDAASGIRVLDSSNVDVSAKVFEQIQLLYPEFLGYRIECPLFAAVKEKDAPISNPAKMAADFGAPYLGKLPMDPNVMKSCESGVSFTDSYPSSLAVLPLNSIIDQIVKECSSSSQEREGGM